MTEGRSFSFQPRIYSKRGEVCSRISPTPKWTPFWTAGKGSSALALLSGIRTLLRPSMTSIDLAPSRRGRILLVGSGPGHPSLPTVATHAALTEHADLVLSDKLVPEVVLALIPPGVEVRMACKFPGNAEGAQMELIEAAIEAANREARADRRLGKFHQYSTHRTIPTPFVLAQAR